ncbi:inner membrane-spanning protein YciB [Caulobacter sp. NIBR1757]|uniref:inner membrane-spanning protein YciB n=1 Tax=Caulobacter sp. NIBR1757 TaxID=3016000 RepID=UPI0022F05257|nr:inner membrane-spanning protein YciB [Caulobacter sp. NIBR1757]WGM38517.1 putative intracellular septation protein A [Caulobacter sp. NIBR1757]
MTEPSATPDKKKSHGWIRTAVDFGGLLAFFIGYLVTHSLVAAAWWLVAGSAVALVVGYVAEKRLAPMPLISGVLALVFGSLTVFFKDPIFLKLKPTITMTLFAVILLGGLVAKKNVLKMLMGSELVMSDAVWRTFTLRYGLFFLAIAILNEIVWRNFDEGVWATFKVFGILGLTVLFSLSQAPLIMRGMKESEAPVDPEEATAAPPIIE